MILMAHVSAPSYPSRTPRRPVYFGRRSGYSCLLPCAVVFVAAVVLALSSCSAKNSSDEDALPSVDSDTSEAVPGTEEATASSIDPETLEVTATIDIGGPSSAVAISEDAVWILGFVGTTNRGRVVRIDPETNEVIATVPVGNRSR